MIFQENSLSKNQTINTNNINKKPTECQSEKLKNLWEKLQDLSEVQDESRNQQMPIFLNDNSIVSRQEETDSFFRTVNILEDNNCFNKNQQNSNSPQLIKYKQNNSNQYYGKQPQYNYSPLLDAQQIYLNSEGQHKYTKIRNKVDNQTEKPYLNHQSSNFQDKNIHNAIKNYNHQTYQKSPQQNQINPKRLLSTQQYLKYINSLSTQLIQTKRKDLQQHLTYNKPQTQVQAYKQNNFKSNQYVNKKTIYPEENSQSHQINVIVQQQKQKMIRVQQTNMKLMEDNKKLFEECIKLRKKINNNQQRNHLNERKINMNEGKQGKQSTIQMIHNKNQESKMREIQTNIAKIQQQNYFLISQIKNQSQTIQQLKIQNQNLKTQNQQLKIQYQTTLRSKIKQIQSQQSQKQQIQLLNLKQILQSQINSKYRNQIQKIYTLINDKQAIIDEKQSQLKDKKFMLIQRQMQLNRQRQNNRRYNQIISALEKKLVVEKQAVKMLEMKINQKQEVIINLNKQIEHMRTNENQPKNLISVQGQKVSRANSIKSTSISFNSSSPGNDFGNGYQNILKDKQRTIKNMKIVHQAELKKLKLTIAQLEHKFIQTSNKSL